MQSVPSDCIASKLAHTFPELRKCQRGHQCCLLYGKTSRPTPTDLTRSGIMGSLTTDARVTDKLSNVWLIALASLQRFCAPVGKAATSGIGIENLIGFSKQ